MDISSYKQVKFTQENLDMVKKRENFKRETESFLTAAQNNAIRTNYIKVKIEKTQPNSKCWLFSNKDERIDLIKGECRKLAQGIRHGGLGKVIYWELCRKLNLTIRTSRIYTAQNPSCRMRWANFSWILRYKQIPDDQTLRYSKKKKKKKRRKENVPNCWFCRPGRPKGKIKRKGDKYLDLAR